MRLSVGIESYARPTVLDSEKVLFNSNPINMERVEGNINRPSIGPRLM